MSATRFAPLLAAAGLALSTPAFAQSSAASGRLEVGAGPVWVGRANLASGAASETTATGGGFSLFTSSETVSSMAGLEARVAFRLTHHLELQGVGSYVAPDLRVGISNDAENAAAVTAAERIHEYVFGGGVLWYLSLGRRVAPFVEVEAAYLRLLHADDTLVETGRAYSAGAGLKYALHTSDRGVRAVGIRVDARAVARSKAVLFDTIRVSPAAGVGVYFRF